MAHIQGPQELPAGIPHAGGDGGELRCLGPWEAVHRTQRCVIRRMAALMGAWLTSGTLCCPAAPTSGRRLQAMRRESPKLGGSFANWGLTFSLFDCSLQYVRKKVSRLAVGACTRRTQDLHRTPGQLDLEAAHGPRSPPLNTPWNSSIAQEDPWNAIGAGALTGGFLQLRSGFKSAAKSAAFGGILLVRICASTVHAWRAAANRTGPLAHLCSRGACMLAQAMIEGLGIALGRLASPPPPGLPQNMGQGGPMPGGLEAGGAEASSSGGGWFGGFFGGEAEKPALVSYMCGEESVHEWVGG